jgi:hypothetical protein
MITGGKVENPLMVSHGMSQKHKTENAMKKIPMFSIKNH